MFKIAGSFWKRNNLDLLKIYKNESFFFRGAIRFLIFKKVNPELFLPASKFSSQYFLSKKKESVKHLLSRSCAYGKREWVQLWEYDPHGPIKRTLGLIIN